MNCDISVIIPLYNKEREIGAALGSALSQTLLPREIIVVDDGSTDRGADIVRTCESPLVRLVTQPNAGVSAARNRGAAESAGKYLALLDADDLWEPRFLEKNAEMIRRYPGCSIYATGFYTLRGGRKFLAKSPKREGVLEDFFREAMFSYVCTASSVVVPRDILLTAGGFPEGMKIGEDLYCWIRLADEAPVCFTPEPLACYVITASNRSVRGYETEKTERSFQGLYRPGDGDSYRNEFIARCAIGKALILSSRGDTESGLAAERFFSYTKFYRRGWRKLRILNRIPSAIRPCVHDTYNRLAWILAHKGL